MPEKAIKTPNLVVTSWTKTTAGNERFDLPWKCSSKKDLPWGGAKRCFHNPGVFRNRGRQSSLTPMFLELRTVSTVGRNADFYTKGKTTRIDVSGQPGFLLGRQCCPGRRASAWGPWVFPSGSGESVPRAGGTGQSPPAPRREGPRRVGAGREGTAAARPRLRVLTVKASVNCTWRSPLSGQT